MGIHIVVLIVLVVILLSIQKKVSETAESVEKRMEKVKNLVNHPSEVAGAIGKALWGQTLSGIARFLKR